MYDSYISVNKNFKSSVNLEYDLYNLEKIEAYIPTTDLCDVIKSYLKSVIGKAEFRSTILAGPYGKGKSYLMLMLTYLLSNNKKSKELISKFRVIDKELADMIEKIDKDNIYLLPVIINSNNSKDINQMFMISLNNSLKEHKLDSIVPNTIYSECLDLINKWEKENKGVFNIFNYCVNLLGIDLEELKTGLKNYDADYYAKFVELYKCISHGASFNPFASNDFVTTYVEVNKKITQMGYKGMFIIFDEFGAFLDNQTADFSERLKNIQQLAEKCNSSLESKQMHFCCITHKDFVLYSKDSSIYMNFARIAERFRTVRFDRTLEENYQIISSAILKNDNYKELVDDVKRDNTELIKKIKDTPIFVSNDQVDYLINNAFPINPIAMYALNQVSEKIGQNERTLFTFISDNDINTFKYFITNNNNGFLNVDFIYDYFENLINETPETHDIYNKVKLGMRLVLKQENHKILKALAIINLINDQIKFNASIDNLALALGKESVEADVQELIDQNILKTNAYDHTIDFSIIYDTYINKNINLVADTKFNLTPVSKMLENINIQRYYVSNRYNFEYKMTRYFEVKCLEYSTLLELTSLESLFESVEGDGIIVNVIKDVFVPDDKIEELSKRFEDNVVFLSPKDYLNDEIIRKLELICAGKYILENSKLDVKQQEAVTIYINDLNNDLTKFFEKFFSNSKAYCKYTDSNDLKTCIYESLRSYYSLTFVVNNEQINKNVVTKQSAKARNNVIDDMIKSNNFEYSPTSPEATIQSSLEEAMLSRIDIEQIIEDYFVNSNGEKVEIASLIYKLERAPYGIRKGVLPFILGKVISELTISTDETINTVLIYKNNRELEITGANLETIVNSPNGYYCCYEKLSNAKIKMVREMLDKFECPVTKNFSKDITCIYYSLLKKVRNLEPILIKSNKKDNLLGLQTKDFEFIKLFMKSDNNIYDTILNVLPKVLGTEHDNVCKKIDSLFKDYNRKIQALYNSQIEMVKNLFVANEGSLFASYQLWKNEYPIVDKIIFEDEYKKIYNALNKMLYDDKLAINLLSNATVNCTLDDWNKTKSEMFIEKLNNFINIVKNYNEEEVSSLLSEIVDTNRELSSIGTTLYSNLLEAIDEYGTSITNEEKVAILTKLINIIKK